MKKKLSGRQPFNKLVVVRDKSGVVETISRVELPLSYTILRFYRPSFSTFTSTPADQLRPTVSISTPRMFHAPINVARDRIVAYLHRHKLTVDSFRNGFRERTIRATSSRTKYSACPTMFGSRSNMHTVQRKPPIVRCVSALVLPPFCHHRNWSIRQQTSEKKSINLCILSNGENENPHILDGSVRCVHKWYHKQSSSQGEPSHLTGGRP